MKIKQISEAIRRSDDPYIKFYPYNTNKREIIRIPGYCARLSDMIGNWTDKVPIMNIPYSGPIYEVFIDDSKLLPMPKCVTEIVGFAGPPTNKIPMDIIKEIWSMDIQKARDFAEQKWV